MTTFLQVAFKASNGKYVTAQGSTPVLKATSDTIGNTENFKIIDHGDNTIALLAANGKYVSGSKNGKFPLIASGESITETEKFVLYNWSSDHRVVLLTSDQKHIQFDPTTAAFQVLNQKLSDLDTFDIVFLDKNGVPIIETAESITIDPPKKKVGISTSSNPSVYTVCFSGTGCTRDEGEISRPQSDKDIYSSKTGYIPVRIHKDISGNLAATTPSVIIRGVGENDWAVPRNNSEPLQFDGPLTPDKSLLNYVKNYSGGNQYSDLTQINGWSAPALALHAANLAVASGKQQFNFIGHSRGAVECIMAAWFIYAYGSEEARSIPINIFAIDPVPGTGQWYSILTQLPPNVVNYVGIYAWDMSVQPFDKPFMALVPRPNGLMTGKDNTVKLYNSWWTDKWKHLANKAQLTDPLAPGTDPQPRGYELYACRGKHSTVAGNATADGKYDAATKSHTVTPVPELIYKMARAYLTEWGTVFQSASAVDERVISLRNKINTNHSEFDAMGGGNTRTSALPLRPFVRRISSIYGINTANSYYMDNVVGDPPYHVFYPVTSERKDAGWVKWKFL